MRKRGKAEIITFKVEAELADAMREIPNRSEFIRRAVVGALGLTCPLCGGSGMLDQREREHWERFARTHEVRECEECHAVHLFCPNQTHGRKGDPGAEGHA